MADKPAQKLSVEGIVAHRDKQPYVVLLKDGEKIAQMSMAAARNVAHDILTMCARTEADAMIFKFFGEHELPEQAAAALMQEFRTFRFELDSEHVETWQAEPTSGPQFDFTKKKPQ